MHDLAGGDGQVAADGERPGVDRRRHAAVVAEVVNQVPRPVARGCGPGSRPALASALGLPSSVLVGAAASVSSVMAKRARSRLFASSSTSSTTSSSALVSTR